MSILRRVSDDFNIHLPVDALVGRGDAYDVPLKHRAASRPHAMIRWVENRWVLRDLGSSNGTHVGTDHVKPGKAKVLRRGVTLWFGTTEETYQFVDNGSPTPLARHLSTGRTVPMRDGLLQLPDDLAPIVSVYEGRAAGKLCIDMAPRLGSAIDREVIDVGGQLWQLRTTTAPGTSTSYTSVPLCVSTMHITFDADPAWEAITLKLADNDNMVDVKHYAHHELLLVLANERARNADAGMDASQCGWLHVGQVATQLGTSEAIVNSLVHKSRCRFKDLNVVPAADAIERRPGQLRIGTGNIAFVGSARLSARNS